MLFWTGLTHFFGRRGPKPGTIDAKLLRGADYLFRVTGGEVIGGPFQGMKISRAKGAWGDGRQSPQLLGCYEDELHPAIEEMIARNPTEVINVGCADGYYAVGLARRLPHSRVTAVDISESALHSTQTNASTNSVAVEVRTTIPSVVGGPTAVVMDVEGDEHILLNLGERPWLADSDVLVELHPWVNPGVEDELVQRFFSTHAIRIFESGGGRFPTRYSCLDGLSDDMKWLMVSEGRPQKMKWLWMTSGSRTSRLVER